MKNPLFYPTFLLVLLLFNMAIPILQAKGWCVDANALEIELDIAEQADRLDDAKRLEEFLLDVRELFDF